MKYVCKYPNKLSMDGYYRKLLEECKHAKQYSELDENEMKKILWFILIKIKLIIEHPKNDLDKTTNYLLKIDELSKEEYMMISEHGIIPESAISTLLGALHDSLEIAKLIANNMNFPLKEEKHSQYVELLKDITIKCSKEIANINRLKSNISKKVIFSKHCTKVSKDKENVNPKYESISSKGDVDKKHKRSTKYRLV